jgi:predicted metal-binding membrane protein
MVERIAFHERLLVLLSMFAVVAISLLVSLRSGDKLMMETQITIGTFAYVSLLFLMWWTMMLAMMLPSTVPAVLTYATISRKFAVASGTSASLGMFVAGYILVWTGFSALAVMLHLFWSQTLALSMMMATTSATLGGVLVLAAGIYQLSPLKAACLHKCQSPLLHLARNWQNGPYGALRMGVSHGLYCLGCCWVLMGLLFYGGIMELRWIIGLAIYVAVEKIIPARNRLSRFSGLFLVGWGVWIMYWALL